MNATINALEKSILQALESQGAQADVNKVYLEFIKANFIVPIEKSTLKDSEPKVLFYVEDEHVYMPVFTNQIDLDKWAYSIADNIDLLKLSGVDLLKGVGDDVFIALNLLGESYKCFLPAEIARMRSMVLKFFG